MKKNELKAIAALLNQLRMKQGLSYEQVAAKAGLPYQTVYYILRGQTNPHILNFQAVCTVFGINLFSAMKPVIEKELK